MINNLRKEMLQNVWNCNESDIKRFTQQNDKQALKERLEIRQEMLESKECKELGVVLK